MIQRTCEFCKTTYETFPSIRLRFCCAKCSSAAKVSGRLKPCLVCEKEFWATPKQEFLGKAIYCSKSCKTTASNLTTANPSFSRDIAIAIQNAGF